ncbi:hypothetical protein [Nonomuraea gerenzanensis]|uniref:Uncharacterized protein n=1 Tax=Nonomuraea gerenzanensis TaxID=93944 RepID=A0A1M4ER45_9ACTN|nr:hypothetical protein [Nonomuraea gerenzanensis]UBU12766.1 hypothetical protein LCN96_52345 [Nonomuraea gerenzanensis]SBP01322.1 hypothetical protein BN4615_P10838 [Nonomuraea gerenzanensis]
MNWPAERDLPEGRHRLLKEFVMTEIDRTPRRRRLPRPAVLAPALGLAAAAAVAVPLLLGGSPAYAVSKQPDGLIRITINETKDPDKLEADLRALGANVVVDYIPMGKKCSPQPRSSHFLSVEEAPLHVFPTPEDSLPGIVIDPRVIGPGQTGVLEFSVSENNGGIVAGIWAKVGEGPIAECTLVDTTEAPLSH